MTRTKLLKFMFASFVFGFLSSLHIKSFLNQPIYSITRDTFTDRFVIDSFKKDDDLYLISIKNDNYHFSFKCNEKPYAIKEVSLDVNVGYERNIFFIKNEAVYLSENSCSKFVEQQNKEFYKIYTEITKKSSEMAILLANKMIEIRKKQEEQKRKKQYAELLKRSI